MALRPVLALLAAALGPAASAGMANLPPTAVEPARARAASPPAADPKGGSPLRPAILPVARSCQAGLEAALGHPERLPGQVDGRLIGGANGLRMLRAAWGDALVVIEGGDFSRADLKQARLHNICFVDAKFTGSDWRGARAAGIGFVDTELEAADLRGADMQHVAIRFPQLERVDARGADWSHGVVSGNSFGSWKGLDLAGARLAGFRFACRPVVGEECAGQHATINFRGAELGGAEIDAYWGDPVWRGARLAGTIVSLRQLLQLDDTRVTGPLIVRERGVAVRLSAAEFRLLRPHLAPRRDVLPRPASPGLALGLRPRQRLLYVAPVVDFDAAVRRGPIFRKLLPTIVAGAISYLTVKAGPGGRISVNGTAFGGNGHLCGLGGTGLHLDGATGWYSAKPVQTDGDPATADDAAVPLVRFRGARAEVYERGHPWSEQDDRRFFDFMLCGARAGFEEMERVPFAPETAALVASK